MTDYTHRTIIVPAAFQQLAQALCEAAAEGDAGRGMFITALSASGVEPATHYISSGPIATEFGDLLPLTSFDAEGEPTTRPGDVATVEAIADQAGIDLPDGTIAALFAAIEVTEQEAVAATLARLKLVICQPTEIQAPKGK